MKNTSNLAMKDVPKPKLNDWAQLRILHIMVKPNVKVLMREEVVKDKAKRAFQPRAPPSKE